MSKSQKIFVILLRMAMGWFLLYQGISAILNSAWTIEPLITSAKTFPEFYASVLDPGVLPYVTYMIKGLYILSGALLLLGIFVRIGALVGMMVMLFFYFPRLAFPYVGEQFYIVDTHLLITVVLAYLFAIRAGEFFGLGTFFKFSRY